jgi:hypothetical protein
MIAENDVLENKSGPWTYKGHLGLSYSHLSPSSPSIENILWRFYLFPLLLLVDYPI